MRARPLLIALATALTVAAPRASAGPFAGDLGDEPTRPLPPAAREADLDEHLGRQLDLSLPFQDQNGATGPLQQQFGDKPVILVLAYYRCPMLCSQVLRGVVKAARDLPWRIGEQYDVLTVSFDPSDQPGDARRKRLSAIEALGVVDAPAVWPYLVGQPEPIRRLTEQVGFSYGKDEHSGQYAHTAAIMVLTPGGVVSRYLYGVDYNARDLRLALLEASAGRVGGIVDRVLMTCYQFDPASRRYAPFIAGFMRIGAALILAAVLVLLGALHAKERSRKTCSPSPRGPGASAAGST